MSAHCKALLRGTMAVQPLHHLDQIRGKLSSSTFIRLNSNLPCAHDHALRVEEGCEEGLCAVEKCEAAPHRSKGCITPCVRVFTPFGERLYVSPCCQICLWQGGSRRQQVFERFRQLQRHQVLNISQLPDKKHLKVLCTITTCSTLIPVSPCCLANRG